VRSYYTEEKITAVVKTLRAAGLIKRTAKARWVPTGQYARISANSQETLDHVAEGVSRFLETVLNNVNARSKAKLLFEQSCKVRHLPHSQAANFRAFVRDQAIAFLTGVDDWLEARVKQPEKHGRNLRTCAAGAFTFAYIDSAKLLRSTKPKRS
jgi:hypothetical protein